ncbi:hypothetical protein BD779DRAFT_1510429 [Infundibulicybe gibba]|nr:hypothetical protein BD779DRAFT_1510429 [Infundibulicybe gibba]
MAYNREWDKGKDTWNDAATWGAPDARGNVRGREEDHYGEGKRRKFNNGAYDASQAYDESGYGGNYNQNKQAEYLQQDPSQDDRQRGGFAKKRLAPSEPSSHVIFLGLDPDFTEADLQAYLSSNSCSVETVTIIRDRSTGSSKGFGFAQFTSTEHARAFVDPLFPFIQALETGIPHNGRRVKIDYSQSATPHEKGRLNRGNMNDGTRDIGNTQSPVLLFRGLDPLSGPQAIYQAMLYSSGHGRDGAKGMKRIILIKDKVTMASFGFTFVEFIDVQSASAVLAATMSPQIHPSGFRISDRPVAASFAHPYSFQPVTDFLSRDEACLRSSMSLGGMDDSWVRYWDEGSTVAVLEFKVDEPAQPVAATQPDKKEKKKNKVVADTTTRPTPAAPSALPVSDKPVTLNFNKGLPKLNAGPVKPVALGFSMDDAASPQDDDQDEAASNAAKSAAKKTVPLIASKKTASNINKWNQVQEELTQSTSTTSTLAAPIKPLGSTSTDPSTPSPGPPGMDPLPAETEFEFSDVTGLTCLLCARQFKAIEQLKRHNKESDLHKAQVARQKVNARKVSEQPKYRDRASERRVLFNQPDAPVPEKEANGPPPPPPPPPPPVNPGKDESNVGNKLLKMMGWKEGTGLGTTGEGRLDPIQTSIYAQGVGLGASKGKEIGKYTEGYSGYVHMAQDAARERYGN